MLVTTSALGSLVFTQYPLLCGIFAHAFPCFLSRESLAVLQTRAYFFLAHILSSNVPELSNSQWCLIGWRLFFFLLWTINSVRVGLCSSLLLGSFLLGEGLDVPCKWMPKCVGNEAAEPRGLCWNSCVSPQECLPSRLFECVHFIFRHQGASLPV